MPKLAINGGNPVRTKLFPAYNYIGDEEQTAVSRVLKSGTLSGFYGSYMAGFLGGPEVQALEKEWAKYFGAKHAIAVNSCTSGLYCAAGAVRLGPGDEAIVSPFTMMATATAILLFNAVPVFADIEAQYFCLDPKSIEARITPRTKAIFVTDICGQPYDADAINDIAKKHGLYVIEDNAQSPMARLNGKYAGTLGDIGVFSLNYHKHIHSGEGGVICTDNDELADRMRMIRNHAEAVAAGRVHDEPGLDINNLIGFNFRMTEIEAAISREQLKKLSRLVEERIKNCNYLSSELGKIPCLKPAPTRPGATHVYYVHPFLFDAQVAGVDKHRFVAAVAKELPMTELREVEKSALIDSHYGYPMYLAPMYQKMIAYGEKQCPFKCPHYQGQANYQAGICPTNERVWKEELIVHEFMRPPVSKNDLDDVVAAFWKVWENRNELK